MSPGCPGDRRRPVPDMANKAAEKAVGESRSSFGRYRTGEDGRYDGFCRFSFHVAVRDGVRLAVDVFRPTLAGTLVEEPLPALWTHTRYQRASLDEDGRVVTELDTWDTWLHAVIRHGYVVATVDVRGAGASFGINRGQYAAEECDDARDITEWIAAEPWCNGNVGMYGRSYLGITQYFAASRKPPHLKAIFPEMASFDHYDYAFGGGIFRETSRFDWQHLTANLDQSLPMIWRGSYQGPAAPVDDDVAAELLEEARHEHRTNLDWYRMLLNVPYRDSRDPISGECLHATRSPNGCLREIAESGIPIYHLAGWFDMFPRDTLLWWANLPNPQKVVIGPWFHVDQHGLDYTAEHLRWYDHWLKGIDTGVMNEDPIHYWTIDAPVGEEWRSARHWPPENSSAVTHYFAAGHSGSSTSINNGTLTMVAPVDEDTDSLMADYRATTGKTNRWTNANGGPSGYPDMAPNDARGLTYTSSPLQADIEITGHPVVHLWIRSDRPDGAFYVHLEDVGRDGVSRYVTEGSLLASHRKLAHPPWNNFGLPWHSGLEADSQPMTGEAVEIVFDLHPTSKFFRAGHRIRVTVTCADRGNDRVPIHDPPARITLYRAKGRPSRIVLPVMG